MLLFDHIATINLVSTYPRLVYIRPQTIVASLQYFHHTFLNAASLYSINNEVVGQKTSTNLPPSSCVSHAHVFNLVVTRFRVRVTLVYKGLKPCLSYYEVSEKIGSNVSAGCTVGPEDGERAGLVDGVPLTSVGAPLADEVGDFGVAIVEMLPFSGSYKLGVW